MPSIKSSTTSTISSSTSLSKSLQAIPPEATSLHLNFQPNFSDISSLANFLATDTQIHTFSISKVPLPASSPATLLQAISNTSNLTTFVLHDASLTYSCIPPLAQVISSQPLTSLTIDLSNNLLNARSIRALKKAVSSRPATFPPINLYLNGNLPAVELFNTVTHGVGALFASVGGIFLTHRAHGKALPGFQLASLAAFALSLVAMMTSSAVYHGHFRYPSLSTKLRKVDHCSIFILIAGSYTPFLVCYTMDPITFSGPFTLVAVWVFAIVGVVRSLMGVDSSKTRAFFALATGWLGLFSMGTMVERMEKEVIGGVVAGGVVYSIGMSFYLFGKRRPWLHVIWHFAVLIAGALHFYALWTHVNRRNASVW